MLFDFYDAKLIKNVTSYLKYLIKYVTAAMRTGQFQGTGSEHSTVSPDIVVIARRAEATAAVLCLQNLGSKRTALPRGAAMHHDVVDFSHKIS